MPAKAKMTDIQKGIKSMENKSIIEAEIRNIITLYYLEASFEARPV